MAFWTSITSRAVSRGRGASTRLLIQRFLQLVYLALSFIHQVACAGGIAGGESIARTAEKGIHQRRRLQPVAAQAKTAGSLAALKAIESTVDGRRTCHKHGQRFANLLQLRALCS